MRVRVKKKGIPRNFRGHRAAGGVVYEADIYPRHVSRLAVKLLVFRNTFAMREFGQKALGKCRLCRYTQGVCWGLGYEKISFRKGKPEQRVMVVDRRYVCVIGLVVGHLDMEKICHEAVHAGFAFAKRSNRDLWPAELDMPEEGVCYPAGRIAATINRLLWKRGLYGKQV